MTKTLVKLGNLIEQIRGVSYKPTDLHNKLDENSVILLRANNINDGKLNFDDVVYVDKSKVKKEQYLKKGDIFICASSGSKELVGKATYINKDLEAVFGAFCKVVRLKNKDYAQYVGHFFNSPVYRSLVNNASQGSNINNLRNEDIEELEINWVENLPQQHRIVAILDQVNELISLRNQQLEQLDLLIKSRFVEMFGDPVINEKKWNVYNFEDITDIITDGEHQTPKRAINGIYLLSARNILNHTLSLNDVDYIDDDEFNRISKRIIPKAGDILLSCSGTIGRCCVVPKNLKFQMVRSVALLRFKNNINPIFMEYLITSDELQNQIKKSATKSSQANLFQGRIKKLYGYIPPLALQNQFAAFVEEVEKEKATVKQSLEWLNTLKASLMQDYFG